MTSNLCHELLQSAANLAQLLGECDGPGPELDRAANYLLYILECEYCSLYSLKTAAHKSSSYIRLNRLKKGEEKVPGLFFNKDAFSVSSISARQANRLNRGEVVLLSEDALEDAQPTWKIWGASIKIRKKNFGLLVIAGKTEHLPDMTRTMFLKLAAELFGAWLARLNTEHRLAYILEFLPSPAVLLNANGQVTVWNPAFAERTKVPASKILGKGGYLPAVPFYGERRPILPDLVMRPDPYWESTYHEFNRKNDIVTGLALCPATEGGPIFLTYKTSVLRDICGRVTGSIHVVRDVTHDREVEIELKRSEQKYRRITKFASIGILLLKYDEIIYHNQYIKDLFGKMGREVSLKNMRQLIHPDDRQTVEEIMGSVFKYSSEAETFEFRMHNKSRIRFLRGHASLLEYEDTPTIQVILDDVTEQKELAEKAKINEIRLYHDSRLTSLGIMAAGIAHELNQPLNTVKMIVEAILMGRGKGWGLDITELYEDMEMSRRQVIRMDEVIQNIRDYAREDQNADMGKVDANEAVKNIFSMIGRQLEAKDILFEKNLAKSLALVIANLHRLEQVIMNLIINARQALEGCQKKLKQLKVWTENLDQNIVIGVEDNASGIPLEIAEKVFAPFFTTKEVGQGTGLGLSISSSILADFGGHLEFCNNSMGGATFKIYLPIWEQPE